MTHKIEKSTECSCFEVLDVLFWGLKASPVAWASFMEAHGGISKWQFLIKKIKIKFPAVNFFQFWVIKPWIRIRDPDPQLEKMLDPDPYPDPHQFNADPKPWILVLPDNICII
jgi:hypothetical protein